MDEHHDDQMFIPEGREDREHVELLLRVARMYYLDHATQNEIARRIGYSRPTVSRLLAEARRRGVVSVNVSHPLEQVLAAEKQLIQRFGLKNAVVASTSPGVQPSVAVGRLAARFVADAGNRRTVLALSNGTSLSALVDAMPVQRWTESCVTQMLGSLARADDLLADSPELCRRLAHRLGGAYRPLPVPIVLTSSATARSVRHEELVVTTLELAARSDIALVGVGAVSQDGRSPGILRPFLTPQIEEEARRGGAVAHICGHHVDRNGKHVPTSLCERTIAMAPERLADVPIAMVTAWGHEKVPALHAVMRAGLVNSLATDEATTHQLLEYRQ